MILRLNTDIASGVVGLAFAAVLWLPRGEMGRLSIIFPRAVLVILVVIAVGLIIKGFIRPGSRRIEISGSLRRLLVVMTGFFVWWFAIGKLGFVVSTCVAVFLLTWYLARVDGPVSWRRLLQWVPIIGVLVGVFYLTFTLVLNVRLPTGLLL
ncbi:tripartite tricarboxylate transporter TctB family protein [Litchfieldella rifensis]|uniref:Tripartite tricarboxylate transporter TctB family protein n=1 Tax=Litchfieldella rifensis TaxID=762643 RepID=A0ABV7LKG2_9GAMM